MRRRIALVIAMAWAAAAAEPARAEWLWTAPNPEVLKWQAEAQERDRAMARRIDAQAARGTAVKKEDAMARRLAKILVSPDMLVELLRGGCALGRDGLLQYVETADVPLDLTIRHVEWDFGNDMAVLIVQSESFPEVKGGGVVPELPVHEIRWTKHQAQILRAE